MLELEGVRKSYPGPGEVVHAVDGASLAVAAGEFVAIFGPSGSGKTTLLLLAGAMLAPDAGTIRFGGRDLGALSNEEVLAYRRSDVGFVFQNFFLIPGMSALDNVSLRFLLDGHRRQQAERSAGELLELVGLSARAAHPAFKLSGGEKQRVAIARALACDPKLVLADEPTGNLDMHRGDEVLTTLSELARGRGVAVVLVTHDLRALRYADRIHEMRDGRLYDYDPRAALAALAESIAAKHGVEPAPEAAQLPAAPDPTG